MYDTTYKGFEEDMKYRAAFEAEHKCKILRVFNKIPPQEFQDIMVREANTYHVVQTARFIDNVLVAEHMYALHGHGYESLSSMLDGLERGFKAALGPCKPYSITYRKVELAPKFRKQLANKTEKEVYESLCLDYYRDPVPDNVFKKQQVTEWFATSEEADKRIKELRGDWQNPPFPMPEAVNDWRVQYDQTKAVWF